MGAFCSSQSNNTNNTPSKVSVPAKGTISATDRAILDLKNARDRLSKYKTNLQRDEKKLSQRAKELHANGQTNMAIQLLKLRRYKLKEVEQVESQLMNLWQLVETINSTQNEQEVVKAMKVGKDALEKMHKELTVDDVLELMDDIKEQHDIESEISTIIGNGVTTFTALDDSEIEAEMVALEKEVLSEMKPQQEGKTQEMQEIHIEGRQEQLDLPEAPTAKLPELLPTSVQLSETRENKVLLAS
mmetsp:Transcript_25955/g.37217  ORF Transcript_25955/g.37217 Transcript_25955/m.37217 type:complete len:244 (-) Transcript_25955:3935-4666(-)